MDNSERKEKNTKKRIEGGTINKKKVGRYRYRIVQDEGKDKNINQLDAVRIKCNALWNIPSILHKLKKQPAKKICIVSINLQLFIIGGNRAGPSLHKTKNII